MNAAEIVKKHWVCEHHSCQGCDCIRKSEALEKDIAEAIKQARGDKR